MDDVPIRTTGSIKAFKGREPQQTTAGDDESIHEMEEKALFRINETRNTS